MARFRASIALMAELDVFAAPASSVFSRGAGEGFVHPIRGSNASEAINNRYIPRRMDSIELIAVNYGSAIIDWLLTIA